MEKIMNLSPDLSLVEPQQFEALWEAINAELDQVKGLSLSRHLQEFLGYRIARRPSSLGKLNHLAVYIGDYEDELLVDCWHNFLLKRKRSGSLTRIDRGPSYIAPREYGAPGWWWSIKRQDGYVIELFCCRSYGRWAQFPVEKKYNLMSHKAITISDKVSVLPALKSFESITGLEIIAYTDDDALGHTYGHVRNNLNNKVIELVWEEAAAVC
jgi:excinuclease ABC subunit A